LHQLAPGGPRAAKTEFPKDNSPGKRQSAAVEPLQDCNGLITAADTGKIDVRPNPDTITS
jgi:hypothetical protein